MGNGLIKSKWSRNGLKRKAEDLELKMKQQENFHRQLGFKKHNGHDIFEIGQAKVELVERGLYGTIKWKDRAAWFR